MASDSQENTQDQPTPASEPGPTAVAVDTTPLEGVRHAHEPDGQALPGKPLSDGGQGKVTVRVRFPHDRFEHGIKNVPAITAQGVEIDRAKAKQINEAAASAGVELEEVEE